MCGCFFFFFSPSLFKGCVSSHYSAEPFNALNTHQEALSRRATSNNCAHIAALWCGEVCLSPSFDVKLVALRLRHPLNAKALPNGRRRPLHLTSSCAGSESSPLVGSEVVGELRRTGVCVIESLCIFFFLPCFPRSQAAWVEIWKVSRSRNVYSISALSVLRQPLKTETVTCAECTSNC